MVDRRPELLQVCPPAAGRQLATHTIILNTTPHERRPHSIYLEIQNVIFKKQVVESLQLATYTMKTKHQ